jgi:MULE transposase domain
VTIDERGNQVEQWILRYGKNRVSTLPTTAYSHELAQNPLIFPQHRKKLPAFTQAIAQATAMRGSYLPFRQAERILHGQGLKIDRNSYYNLARAQAMESSSNGLLALVSVLKRDRWTYYTFWDFTYSEIGVVTQQVLKAVFFTNDELIKLARRFTPDWMIQMDGTFNTNRIKMPLIDVLGVTNTGHSFIFAFCFVTSESSAN